MAVDTEEHPDEQNRDVRHSSSVQPPTTTDLSPMDTVEDSAHVPHLRTEIIEDVRMLMDEVRQSKAVSGVECIVWNSY